MSRAKLTVVFNYRSPFCALVVERLFDLSASYDVDIQWRIARHVPRPSSLPITPSNPRFQYNREDCARRARWMGLPWQAPSWRLADTVAAARLGQWLLETGSPLFRVYTIRVSRAYWCEGENISDSAVIARIARECGLTDAHLDAAEQQQEQIDGALDENAYWCERTGVLGAPFFVLDDERFWGSDRLGALQCRLAEKGLGPASAALGAEVLFAGAPIPTLPIAGKEARIGVQRIFCVGRNYADHAREMGQDPAREQPFFFMKPHDAVALSGACIAYPPATENFHYEMELVAIVGRPLFQASASEAATAIFGYAAGLDMTRRDLQLSAREKGRPWELGKSFEQSAVIGPVRCVEELPGAPTGRIALRVNDEVRQNARLSDMIWSVPEILASLSQYYQLRAGDVIFTGTPAGVGPAVPGDVLRGEIENVGAVEATVAGRAVLNRQS